jgi:hypothetical protein
MTVDMLRRVATWDQMVLGGGAIRFHQETINGYPQDPWECKDTTECDLCHAHEQQGVQQ